MTGPSRPNVLLINCDDLGYGDLACYGSTRNATPRLDALAADGIRFTSFYMASPVCSPSRAALLTGCYPPRIGFGSFDGLPVLFPGQGIGLPDTEVTLATLLKGAGYRTQMVGKWHCGDQPEFLPTRHGFDHYFGLPYSNDMGRQVGPPKILDWLPPLPLLENEQVIEQQPDQASLTERYVETCLQFIDADDERPFFLYLAHLYVHLPIYVSDEALAASANGPYGAAVGAIDWATGVLLDHLAAKGLLDNTLVIFTSDNGSLGDVAAPWGPSTPLGGSNAPLSGAKGSTLEGGMRVPMIVAMKDRIEPGRVDDTVCSSLDLLPTIAKLCGVDDDAIPVVDGNDVSMLWFEGVGGATEHFAYYRQNDLEAVRGPRFKLRLVDESKDARMLFDLSEDPGEYRDVANRHPDEVAALEAVAEHFRADLGDERVGRVGAGCRPAGRVEHPRPLTRFDPDHPYVVAEYDLPHKG